MKRIHCLVGAVLILSAVLLIPAPGNAQTYLEIRLTLVSSEMTGPARAAAEPQVRFATSHRGDTQGLSGTAIVAPVIGTVSTSETDLPYSQYVAQGQNSKIPYIPPVTNTGREGLPQVQPAVAVVVVVVPVPVTDGGNRQPTIKYMLPDTGSRDTYQQPIIIPADR